MEINAIQKEGPSKWKDLFLYTKNGELFQEISQ